MQNNLQLQNTDKRFSGNRVVDLDGQKGEITKDHKDVFASDGYVHNLGSTDGFTLVSICQNLPNYFKYVQFICISVKQK